MNWAVRTVDVESDAVYGRPSAGDTGDAVRPAPVVVGRRHEIVRRQFSSVRTAELDTDRRTFCGTNGAKCSSSAARFRRQTTGVSQRASRGTYSKAELSMGPFCVTRPNPTHQLTDPTQPNALQVKKFVIGYHYHFITPSDQFPVPVRSAVKPNLTD